MLHGTPNIFLLGSLHLLCDFLLSSFHYYTSTKDTKRASISLFFQVDGRWWPGCFGIDRISGHPQSNVEPELHSAVLLQDWGRTGRYLWFTHRNQLNLEQSRKHFHSIDTWAAFSARKSEAKFFPHIVHTHSNTSWGSNAEVGFLPSLVKSTVNSILIIYNCEERCGN